jgi:hypothetical protein
MSNDNVRERERACDLMKTIVAKPVAHGNKVAM